MRKKRFFAFIILAIIIISSIYFGTRKNEVTFYLGVANSSSDSINVLMSLDTLVLYNDILQNNPFKYEIIESSLRLGFYTLSASEICNQNKTRKRIFVLHDQHIVVEYYEHCERQDSLPCFVIRNRFTPFYLE